MSWGKGRQVTVAKRYRGVIVGTVYGPGVDAWIVRVLSGPLKGETLRVRRFQVTGNY